MAALQEYIPFFFLSISSIRQSPMILLLLPFLCFFLENLEKRTRLSKCFLLAACFYSRKGNENPFTGEKQVSVNEFINYERQSINEKAQITQGAFDSFVCGCTHAMDPRTNCSFNSQDNAWSSDQSPKTPVPPRFLP